METVRVLILADDPLARAGLSMQLAGQSLCEVVGEVSIAALLPEDIPAYNADVLLVDLGWDGSEADSLVQFTGENYPPIVALLPADMDASGLFAKAVTGVFARDSDPAQLAAALLAASQSTIVLDPVFAEVLPVSSAETGDLDEPLTPREIEVLQLIAEGLSNRAIALELDISAHTVKFHINALLGKLNAQSRTEAVVRAARLGIIYL
nr:response regulator transcription factor [Anaerolineae bacterium]